MSAANEELLTPQELAERLKMSISTIKRMARQGQIPSMHLGRQALRFSYSEVLNSMRSDGRSAG